MDILSFFFPKKCVGCKRLGNYLCSDCFAYLDFSVSPICAVCSRPAISGLTHPKCQSRYSIDGVFSALVYKGVVKRLVYQFKFEPYLSDLAFLLGEFFYEGIIQQEAFHQSLKENSLLIPIPLHVSRLRKRGYNQSLLLASDLSKRFNLPVVDILQRTRVTKSQVGLSQKERRENLKDVFSLKAGIDIKNKNIYLVDDILTSGATLSEAAKVLKKSGAGKVFGLTLAHGT